MVSFSGLNLKSGQYISLLLRYRPEVILTSATTLSSVRSGDIVTFTLRLLSGGSTPAAGVTLTMPLPAGLSEPSYQATLDSGLSITRLPGPDYAWSISDMANGKGGTVAISGRLTAGPGQTVSTTATLSTNDDFDTSLSLPISDDAIAEGAETLSLTLSGGAAPARSAARPPAPTRATAVATQIRSP